MSRRLATEFVSGPGRAPLRVLRVAVNQSGPDRCLISLAELHPQVDQLARPKIEPDGVAVDAGIQNDVAQ
jgi:hypothetical protein